jgi:DNA-binding GntR family transcriptional regulator
MTDLPRYREIANDLRRRLAAKEFAIESMLPSISALQDQYDVLGLNTIRQALAILQEEGLIKSVQGKGTFVIALPAPTTGLEALREDVAGLKRVLKDAQLVLARMERHLG